MKLMVHLIPFFPSEKDSLQIAEAAALHGADYLELQFPFSDPSADGTYIQNASSMALDNAFTVEKGFSFIRTLVAQCNIPIFVMTYANVVYNSGIGNFVTKLKESGAKGLIVPDLPFDSEESQTLVQVATDCSLVYMPVAVVTMSIQRVREMIRATRATYLYVSLRAGITGEKTEISQDSFLFLQNLSQFKLKTFGGFGICTHRQIEPLDHMVYGVVAGTVFVKAVQNKKQEESAADAVGRVVRELKYGYNGS